MRRDLIERGALWLLTVFALPVGLQAAVAPRSFFDDFPFGRSWISVDGAMYDEHLVRDVGALFLAMAIVTGRTASPGSCRAYSTSCTTARTSMACRPSIACC